MVLKNPAYKSQKAGCLYQALSRTSLWDCFHLERKIPFVAFYERLGIVTFFLNYAGRIMNKFQNTFMPRIEANLRYDAAEFHIMTPGDFVRCAVTGNPILLENLKYWSVELQEPYSTSKISLDRYLETTK